MTSRRLISLFCAGLLILGLVVFRERQLQRWKLSSPPGRALPRALAPRFDLADHTRHVVKFERFLGREPVVLVFFDGKQGPLEDPCLKQLLQCRAALERAGIKVVGVSDATPFANQQALQQSADDYPFPLLTDLSVRPDQPANSLVHRQWGRYDVEEDRSLTGLFLIARDGTVPIGADGFPEPVADEAAVLKVLCSGKWPR